jgi:hypothetical protein
MITQGIMKLHEICAENGKKALMEQNVEKKLGTSNNCHHVCA